MESFRNINLQMKRLIINQRNNEGNQMEQSERPRFFRGGNQNKKKRPTFGQVEEDKEQINTQTTRGQGGFTVRGVVQESWFNRSVKPQQTQGFLKKPPSPESDVFTRFQKNQNSDQKQYHKNFIQQSDKKPQNFGNKNSQQQPSKKARFISYKDLEALLRLNSDQIVEKLNDYSSLTETINITNFSVGLYSLFIRVLHNLLLDKSLIYQEYKNNIYSAFNASNFYQNIASTYFSQLSSSMKSMSNFLERLEDLKTMIELFNLLLEKFRSQADKFPIANLRSYIKDELPYLKDRYDDFDNLQLEVNKLSQMSKDLKEKQKNARVLIMHEKFKEQQIKQDRRAAAKNKDEDYKVKPPDDFQNISIIPTLQELTQPGKPFLRAMPAQGGRFIDKHDYLDLIFRLLREDAIDPLRKGLKLMQSSMQMNQKEFSNELRNSGCRVFENVSINDVIITRVHQGLTMIIRIYDDRSQNWNSSKKLLPGSLLMISNDNFKSINFCIVVERDQRKMTETSRVHNFADITVELIIEGEVNEKQNFVNLDNSDLSDDDNQSFNYKKKQNTVLDFYLKNKGLQFKMIESTAYFESYKHVLQKIKDMDKWEDLPLRKYLIGEQTQNIDPPPLLAELDQYGQLNYFNQRINLGIQKASFDNSQTQAIRTCFYKELAIIQGPPGTGKTYVGEHYVRLMIENKDLWRKEKGPILLVCYTNHALDQFLHLISNYTSNFIRFGGRCKDESLKQNQMRDYIKNNNIKYPRSYGQTIEQLDQASDSLTLKKLNFQLNSLGIINSRINYVSKLIDDIYNGFWKSQFQTPIFDNSRTLEECIQEGKRYQAVQVDTEFYGPYNLSLQQRWSLNNYYCRDDRNINTTEITELVQQCERLFKQRKLQDEMTQIKAIMQADIVAMTTTGQEAAEVFEAHILTALSQKTEQVVLIGDHQQLRPSPAVFELEKNYNLNMSLFERLVKNDFEYVTLLNQRRMRPEISEMIRFLYPNLEDDQRVKKYPDIKGIEKSVYFFDHQNEEDYDEGNMSKMNNFEAEMIEKFSFYLLQQGYDPEKITVLSLYMAQSSLIKKKLQNFPNEHPIRKIKVITVDNFQGEENDIIILSLVRSNQRNDIGYLKVSNRVCVALSRAKHGMFIFGNSSCLYKYVDQQTKKQFVTLDEQSMLWEKVLEYLKKNEFIGQTLNLCCVNHKIVTKVKVPKDFQEVPEGGCKLACNIRMECGHTCQSLCHYYEQTILDSTGHSKYKCLKSCEREHKCGHKCNYKCFQCKGQLQPCRQIVEKIFDKCQHNQNVQCSEFEKAQCKSPCEIVKPCGHKCTKDCYVDCEKQKCGVNVEKTLPCGHNHEIKCYLDPEEFALTDKHGCPKICGAKLDCGHFCKEKCGECQMKDFHGICNEKIDNVFQCGHTNKSTCGKQSMLCQLKCETKCVHSKCPKKCYEPCVLCMEQCEINCEHFKCEKKCSQPCNKKLCQSRCSKILKCGHRCIGLCGDSCPKVCKICQPQHETFEIFFGTEDEDKAKFVVIDCGHILESSSLDKFIQTSRNEGQVKFAECPKCKTPIKKCLRYQSQINSTLQDMNQIKIKNIQSHLQLMKQYDNLATKCDQLQKRAENYITTDIYQIKKLLQQWALLYQKAGSSEGLLRNCAIKLELLSFIVTFRVYSDTHQPEYLYQDFVSFCRVSIYKILKSKFIVEDSIKSEMRKKAEIMDKDYNFKETAQMIVNAMGLGNGRFFKCPNGHYYAIGECGGAMEQSKCPDCGAIIGGSNHSLASGNQHAGEIDGSQRPAWDPHGFDQQVLNGQVNLNQHF
eukprot:403353380